MGLVFKLLAVKDENTGTFSRVATGEYNLKELGNDDILVEDSQDINILAIPSLAYIRRVAIVYRSANTLYLGLSIVTMLMFFITFIAFAVGIVQASRVLFTTMAAFVSITSYFVLINLGSFYFTAYSFYDRYGNFINLQDGYTNLNGGCHIK